MSLQPKSTSLADEINSLITAVPENLDSDYETEETTKAKLVDKYEELDDGDQNDLALISTIRKRNISLLDQVDERYEGKKISSKDLYGNSVSSDDDSDAEEEDDDDDDDDSNEEMEDDGDDDGNDSEVDEDNPLRRERDPRRQEKGNLQGINSMKSISAEVEKGHCVRQQLKLWEQLVEMRIQLQKALMISNQLPQFDIYKQLILDKEFSKSSNEAQTKLTSLLNNLLDVQERLLRNNSETKDLLSPRPNNNEEEDEEILSSDSDNEEKNDDGDEEEVEPMRKRKRRTLNEFENILSEREKQLKKYRYSVIQKWNDKTRLASGNATKGALSNNQSVIKQIEYVLNDKSKLIKRTQLKRSEYQIVGKTSIDETNEDGRRTQEYEREIYDDDDYYHQLLRELIEQKSADITDPIQLSKQWIQLQNMRNKMKRKIDTRATKGRRIRYNIHSKLVNFMAPMTATDTSSDLAQNELYKSLFGKASQLK